MKKYPYIGKSSNLFGDFSIAIFYGEKRGALLENTIDDAPLHEYLHDFNEIEFENITADYLRNTHGKVESKEHAEFIVKLAEGSAFDADEYHQVDKWFCFSENHLFFFIEESGASDAKEKLITLPLPPKESEEPNTKEWPAVGDEVLTMPNEKAVVKAVDGGLAWIKYDREDLGYATEYVKSLKKPPTPEEELANKLDEAASATIEIDDLIKLSKAIINGEVKGISYER